MSKVPLPPPSGFKRKKQVFGSSKRYVYPFTDSINGQMAQALHEGFLADEEKRWKKSKLRQIAIQFGRIAIKERQYTKQSVDNELALKLGVTLVSMKYPLFMKRNPLDQVYEHLRSEPRYFMKLDIADAFGCVYPGFHENFLRVQKGCSDDLFAWGAQSAANAWDGWPFFHADAGGLIQGAPSSPLLFEKACALSGLDRLLRETAHANNAVVTRYVDDIVFSRLPFDGRPFGRRMYKTLRNRIEGCGFVLNRGKDRRCVDTHTESIRFLGVSVYKNRAKVDPAFFTRVGGLGYLTEGHYSWLDQIERLRHELLLVRAKRAGN